MNTRLHLPDETRTAVPLFKDDFATASFQANAFYAYDDFHELAMRLALRPTRFKRMMQAFRDKEQAVLALVDRSGLSRECKRLYKRHVRDSMKAFAYSFTGLV